MRENVKYISFNKLISSLATFTLSLCLSHSKCDKAPLPHALVYSVFASSPHSSPAIKAFFLPHLVSPDIFFATYGRYFSRLVDTYCSSVRYFQLWWQPLPTTMDCTCRAALVKVSRFISVCRLYNAGAGEKRVALTSMILFEFKPVLY